MCNNFFFEKSEPALLRIRSDAPARKAAFRLELRDFSDKPVWSKRIEPELKPGVTAIPVALPGADGYYELRVTPEDASFNGNSVVIPLAVMRDPVDNGAEGNFGFTCHITRRERRYSFEEFDFDLLRRLGVSNVRVDVGYDDIGGAQSVLRRVRAAGLNPLGIITSSGVNGYPAIAKNRAENPAMVEKWAKYGIPADYAWYAEQVYKLISAHKGVVRDWEFGNENNFKKQEDAAAYVEVLKQIRPLLNAEAPGVKLLSIGFANGFGGVKSLEMVARAGGWPLLDGIAYHLGRGNTVPDLGNVGDGWFYLSSLQELEKLIAKYGAKPIYLTEIYTPTFPNIFWDDSLRNATENVPLSYAIAQAHGVKIAYYYQLNDSVWFDIGGVNSRDREYSFGLLYRNGNVKPTLLAYQTAAKMLDKAKFEKQWKSGNTSRGYVFSKPDGSRVALLWDRTDGYNLNQNTPDFVAQEPWIPFWKSRVPVRVKCAGTEIELVNPIGQVRRIPVKNGVAELTLSGEPVWIVGNLKL